MSEDPPAVGRRATGDDVSAVTACLASAFYNDPVWGRWTFPETASRPERLYALMRFWVVAGSRHAWVWMTGGAEAVAVWVPPGVKEMTSEQESELEAFVTETLGTRAHEVLSLFERFAEHHPAQEPTTT
jgi:hypothetical protein